MKNEEKKQMRKKTKQQISVIMYNFLSMNF